MTAAAHNHGAVSGSRWRQIRYTPLRDVVRGRISGRLDVEAIIDAAALPDSLRRVVQTVVSGTRLWRLERTEIARELISHFQDGLDAGRTPEELAAAFGDPSRASRLIRRAKKRNRPLAWRAGRRTLQGVLILLGLYVIFAARMLLLKPTISHDYVADLNRVPAAVPPAQRAWPLYREALVKMKQSDFTNKLLREREAAALASATPGSETFDRIVELLDEQQEQVALVRQAALMPGFGFVAGHRYTDDNSELWPAPAPDPPATSVQQLLSQSTMMLLLPYLSEMRDLAHVLRFDARRAAAAGDAETALANLRAMRGIAGHVREIPLVINDLVSIAILAMMFEQIGDFLSNQPHLFSEEQLHGLAHEIAAIHDRDIALRLNGERLGFEDLIQRLYSDNGRGDGRLTWSGVRLLTEIGTLSVGEPVEMKVENVVSAAITPGLSMVIASRREMLSKHQEMMNAIEAYAALPLWQRTGTDPQQQIEAMAGSSIERIRYMPLVLLMPAVSGASRNAELSMQRRDAMLVAIALELHRRRHGAWPQSLNELVPVLLPSIPTDRFDGRPLKYVVRDGTAFVYSVGANRVDDGGEPPPPIAHDGSPDWRLVTRWYPDPKRAVRAEVGDWVLWPKIEAAP